MDRLAVLADRVLVADYKTNRRPPAELADTPVMYLRQMAAYRAVLRAIFPGPADRVRAGLDRGRAILPGADLMLPARRTLLDLIGRRAHLRRN